MRRGWGRCESVDIPAVPSGKSVDEDDEAEDWME